MNKSMWAGAFFFALSCLSMEAQQSKISAFFEKSLKGEPVVWNSSEKVKLKEVDERREMVWEEWLKVNHNLKEEKLIGLRDLSFSAHGDWRLPPDLEPHAVMPYYYGSKGERPQAGYPLFLYLHGSGPKVAEWETGLKLAQCFDDAPSVYFVPQIPNEGAYYRWYLRSKQYAYEKLFRQVMLDRNVNPNRLYLLGISEGGYGSQRLASFYADYWAAAGPMAGGEPLKNAPVENCGNIGFSLLTGALDRGFYRDVLTGYTRLAFDSLSKVFPEQYVHRVELIPGRGHGIDYRPTTPWLKTFVRNPWPRHFVWEDFEMDGRHRKGFYNIVVKRRPDSLLRTRYEMNISENVVRVDVMDVKYVTIQKDPQWGIEMKFNKEYVPSRNGKFIIYLNEHLVDLGKKVTLIVNGKKIFRGRLQCDTKNMVNSLSVFYDPCRIYPAAFEVNL